MYELIVEQHFSAAHRLRDYDGNCARVHGHNYAVEISVVGEHLKPEGYVMDFGELKDICGNIIGRMDHRLLNDLPEFTGDNPTCENIARIIFDQVKKAIGDRDDGVRPARVRVSETSKQSATYREE